MELHAFYFQFAMAQPHDCAVGCFGGDFERAWERFSFDDQRVIPRGGKILRQAAENRFA